MAAILLMVTVLTTTSLATPVEKDKHISFAEVHADNVQKEEEDIVIIDDDEDDFDPDDQSDDGDSEE